MKIEGVHEQFLDAVAMVEKISGRNLALSVLNCILLSAHRNTVNLRATNLDLGIEIGVPMKVGEEGRVAVPGSVLHNTLLSVYEGRTISLSTQEGNLFIRTPNGKTTIKALPHDDFPTLPKVDKTAPTTTLKPDMLIDGIKSVWYSASTSSIKPELSSVYIYPHNKQLYFVATDSFRLAEKIISSQTPPPDFDPILVPLKNIPEIIRILERIGEGGEEDVTATFAPNQLSLTNNTLYLVSRLIDGVFPDYKQIIPKEGTTEAVVLKQDLLNVLKKTTIFSDAFNQVRFSVHPQKKTFTIASKNSEVGETLESVHAALTGEDLEISFNYKYIMDCFQAIHSDSISLSFSGTARPMIVRGVSDKSFLYLVMPMNK